MGSRLEGRIAARARRFGPLRWSAFMEAALYDAEDGFYQAGGQAGRGGDFMTSPERGPLFATVCARALDECWDQLGRPDPFVVVEAAAGAGTLARDILAAGCDCAPALRYVLVEQSPTLRALQGQRLPLEPPSLVLGPASGTADPDEDDADGLPGIGPLVTALAELPAIPVTGVILANELLDNLPVDLLEWRHGRWHDVLVAADPSTDELVELVVPAPPETAAEAHHLVAGAAGALAEGARIPRAAAAVEWLRQALATVARGRVIVIDYADRTDALAHTEWSRWLRSYRQHQETPFPLLQRPGSQDITCVVPWDQLAEALRPPDANVSQGEWLAAHGLDELVEEARDQWQQRAGVGDLAALGARSRVHEAQALSDPRGLGGHRVFQWRIGTAGVALRS